MTNLSKLQLNAILSALDGQPRNPNSRDAALRAIGRHAERLGLGLDDLLAAAAGLLDGRMSADEFRAQLHESTGESVASDADDGGPDAGQTDDDSPAAAQTAPEANNDDSEPLASPPHALDHPADAASPQSSPTSKRALTVKQQLLAACHAAEHWLQAERDRSGETRPDEILRVLRAAIARAEGQPRQAHEPRRQRPHARAAKSRR